MVQKSPVNASARDYFKNGFEVSGLLGKLMMGRLDEMAKAFLFFSEEPLPESWGLGYGLHVSRGDSLSGVASHVRQVLGRTQGVLLLHNPCASPTDPCLSDAERVVCHGDDVYHYCRSDASVGQIVTTIKRAETGFPFVGVCSACSVPSLDRGGRRLEGADLEAVVRAARFAIVGILDFESFAVWPVRPLSQRRLGLPAEPRGRGMDAVATPRSGRCESD